jgi:uncharacterized protein (DUF488 family)
MPWFNRGELQRSLAASEIGYEHLEELGGRRPSRADSPNGAWRVGQFRGYADHMASPEFERGLTRLLVMAGERSTAVMCAEAQWTSCHRRLLADVLCARGHEVVHIGSRGVLERHELTEFARVRDARVTYPPEQQSLDL